MKGLESAGSGGGRTGTDEAFLQRNALQIALAKKAFPGVEGGDAMMEWATGPLSSRFARYEKMHPELDLRDSSSQALDAIITELRAMTDDTVH
ncbi:MAG: hypothetical protein KBC38_03605 [Candidatus Pacebacteria bacterium]|nr:hypothetical protein [Candidatus Paceibacterota bacterium]MBP9840142.1 hypothetical protein [Candidatus Paceibacterota bacterium]